MKKAHQHVKRLKSHRKVRTDAKMSCFLGSSFCPTHRTAMLSCRLHTHFTDTAAVDEHCCPAADALMLICLASVGVQEFALQWRCCASGV